MSSTVTSTSYGVAPMLQPKTHTSEMSSLGSGWSLGEPPLKSPHSSEMVCKSSVSSMAASELAHPPVQVLWACSQVLSLALLLLAVFADNASRFEPTSPRIVNFTPRKADASDTHGNATPKPDQV